MEAVELRHQDLSVTVDPGDGGRVTSFTVNTHDILVASVRDTYDWGMYVMAPYAGRVRDAAFSFNDATHLLPAVTDGHALHGTVLHLPWVIAQATDSSVTLTTELGNDWPFKGSCTHRISLLPNRLRCELSVTPHETMPLQLGWHPWFVSPSHVDFSFNAMLARDESGITTDQRVSPPVGPYDDCFLEPNAWPRVTIGDVTIEIASDCPFWVRYDAPTGDVCIEPQSGPPNGLNTSPLIRRAGETFNRWMELRVV